MHTWGRRHSRSEAKCPWPHRWDRRGCRLPHLRDRGRQRPGCRGRHVYRYRRLQAAVRWPTASLQFPWLACHLLPHASPDRQFSLRHFWAVLPACLASPSSLCMLTFSVPAKLQCSAGQCMANDYASGKQQSSTNHALVTLPLLLMVALMHTCSALTLHGSFPCRCLCILITALRTFVAFT